MIQLTLPAAPVYESWLQNCTFLLQVANSGCKTWPVHDRSARDGFRDRFYTLKSEILLAHGHQQGFDLQHIAKQCWGCDGTGLHREYDGEFSTCWKCHGTRLYSERWVLLARYNLAGLVFHCPAGDVQAPATKPNIEGLIQHKSLPHSWEAFKVLSDGRYTLQDRCTNHAAQELIHTIRLETGDALPKQPPVPF